MKNNERPVADQNAPDGAACLAADTILTESGGWLFEQLCSAAPAAAPLKETRGAACLRGTGIVSRSAATISADGLLLEGCGALLAAAPWEKLAAGAREA